MKCGWWEEGVEIIPFAIIIIILLFSLQLFIFYEISQQTHILEVIVLFLELHLKYHVFPNISLINNLFCFSCKLQHRISVWQES